MSGNWMESKSVKWIGLAAVLAVLSLVPIWYFLRQRNQTPALASQTAESANAVSCMGRIEPEDGVIHVAGPYIWGDSHAPRVEKLNVREGEDVHRGQALAAFVG